MFVRKPVITPYCVLTAGKKPTDVKPNSDSSVHNPQPSAGSAAAARWVPASVTTDASRARSGFPRQPRAAGIYPAEPSSSPAGRGGGAAPAALPLPTSDHPRLVSRPWTHSPQLRAHRVVNGLFSGMEIIHCLDLFYGRHQEIF